MTCHFPDKEEFSDRFHPERAEEEVLCGGAAGRLFGGRGPFVSVCHAVKTEETDVVTLWGR